LLNLIRFLSAQLSSLSNTPFQEW